MEAPLLTRGSVRPGTIDPTAPYALRRAGLFAVPDAGTPSASRGNQGPSGARWRIKGHPGSVY
ncbi:hypothetical protein [Streptomyces sp. NPDC058326]|uniref:hypothetical protein n=1 Tax=Streptomyces sp. NPDC058326 TaxID=3346447 RepID=UPI0036E262E2